MFEELVIGLELKFNVKLGLYIEKKRYIIVNEYGFFKGEKR